MSGILLAPADRAVQLIAASPLFTGIYVAVAARKNVGMIVQQSLGIIGGVAKDKTIGVAILARIMAGKKKTASESKLEFGIKLAIAVMVNNDMTKTETTALEFVEEVIRVMYQEPLKAGVEKFSSTYRFVIDDPPSSPRSR